MSYVDDRMSNEERKREVLHYHQNDANGYMWSDKVAAQHFMPVGEEDDDRTVLMLQGAQRSELNFSYVYWHS